MYNIIYVNPNTRVEFVYVAQSSVPPPPPMPPPPDLCDPSEVRPFMDPYGRAKTVRIGKWRWPPLSDGTSNGVAGDANGFPTHQSFFQFKMSKQQNQRHKQSQVGCPASVVLVSFSSAAL